MPTMRRKNNSYEIRVLKKIDYTGKKVFKYKTWKIPEGMSEKKAKEKAKRIAYEFEQKCRSGEVVDDNIRLCDFAEIWFRDYAEKQLRENTISQYREKMPRINAAIGHIKLKDLRPHHLIEFYNNLGEKGIRLDTKYRSIVDIEAILKERGIKKTTLAESASVGINTVASACKGNNVLLKSAEGISGALNMPLKVLFEQVENAAALSDRSVKYYHQVLSSILSTAEEWEAISSNPCKKVRPKRQGRKNGVKHLELDEARRLLEAVKTQPPKYRLITQLLLCTGMRKEEAYGLEWKDIDFQNEVIHICRTSVYISGRGIVTDETKNSSSARTIKVQSFLIAELKRFKAYQTEERLKVGDRWHDTDRLFTQWDGEPASPQTYTAWFKRFIREAGLPEITPHGLRHTNASILIGDNTPITTVSGRLGHATPSTTMSIYAHEIKSADAAAAERLDDLLSPTKEKY